MEDSWTMTQKFNSIRFFDGKKVLDETTGIVKMDTLPATAPVGTLAFHDGKVYEYSESGWAKKTASHEDMEYVKATLSGVGELLDRILEE